MKTLISKSEYMMYLKHPALLWLKKHDKNKIPEPDANLQAMFDEGNLFEEYANNLFNNPTILGFNNYQEYLSLPEKTKESIKRGDKVITQGRIETDNLTCIFDVLERVEDNIFNLYEIKSSTSAKIEHNYDLAFQKVVLEESGLEVDKIFVIHVNGDYVREGEIDIKRLSKTVDVTEEVNKLISSTKINIEKAIKVINMESIPNISPALSRLKGLSDWLEICKKLEYVPPYNIYDLYSIDVKKIKELEDLNIKLIEDIPDDFELSEKQRRQVMATKNDKVFIDKKKIGEFVGELKFPLHFFDYETFSGVIPRFDGLKPYQQVPFQYSLHIQEKPNGELIHKEYLHTDNSNPVPNLLKQLKEDIKDSGSIIVWYQPFEKGRNSEMSEMYPEYKDFLNDLNTRILDLMIPFSEGYYVDKRFLGGASIKKVLPVLVPELSYESLYISEGGAAQRVFTETVLNENKDDRDKKIEALKEYCELDTFAMVKILLFLDDIIKE